MRSTLIKCRSIKPHLLIDYIDGQLDSDSAQKIHSHIGSCPSCFQAVQKIKMAQKALGELAQEERSPVAATAGRLCQKPRFRWVWVIAPLVAAVLFYGIFSRALEQADIYAQNYSRIHLEAEKLASQYTEWESAYSDLWDIGGNL